VSAILEQANPHSYIQYRYFYEGDGHTNTKSVFTKSQLPKNLKDLFTIPKDLRGLLGKFHAAIEVDEDATETSTNTQDGAIEMKEYNEELAVIPRVAEVPSFSELHNTLSLLEYPQDMSPGIVLEKDSLLAPQENVCASSSSIATPKRRLHNVLSYKEESRRRKRNTSGFSSYINNNLPDNVETDDAPNEDSIGSIEGISHRLLPKHDFVECNADFDLSTNKESTSNTFSIEQHKTGDSNLQIVQFSLADMDGIRSSCTEIPKNNNVLEVEEAFNRSMTNMPDISEINASTVSFEEFARMYLRVKNIYKAFTMVKKKEYIQRR